MTVCLGINEDIQQTFQRYETFKKQNKPRAFQSVFLGEYSGCNLFFKNENENKSSQNSENTIQIQGNSNVDFLGFGGGNMMQNENNNQSHNNQNNNNSNNSQQDGKKYAQELNDIFG